MGEEGEGGILWSLANTKNILVISTHINQKDSEKDSSFQRLRSDE